VTHIEAKWAILVSKHVFFKHAMLASAFSVVCALTSIRNAQPIEKKHFGHADQAIVSLNTWRATDYSQNKLLSNAYPMSLATRGLLQFSGLQYVTSYSATSVRLNDRAVEKLTQLSGEQDV
jgi:hypothetical protein